MERTAEQNIANDYKVVSFRNAESFDFTPDMGCMYDGRPITGSSGKPGIAAGEVKMLPYHVGWCLATNLAKQVLLRKAGSKPELDAAGNPMPTKAIWDDQALDEVRRSFVEEMYSEEKPAAQTETDKLFARITALENMLDDKKPEVSELEVVPVLNPGAVGFKDKQEVLAELEKRNIPHDKRAGKEKLEELLK